MSRFEDVYIKNSDGTEVDVQHPIPTNGDSVYVKDIDNTNSDNGDFSGEIYNYFNDLKTINTNTTSDNPKVIKLWFKRTVYSHSIGLGCDNMAFGFGNSITIELLGSGETIRKTINSTGNVNSRLIEFGKSAFNGVNIKFNTAGTVCVSNITIQKSTESNSTIHGEVETTGEIGTVPLTRKKNFKVSVDEYGDTPSIDAFARLRTSQPYTIFDSKQLHDKQPLFWDEVTAGSSTSVHNPVNSSVEMSVTADSNDYVIRQTKQRFNYQPGKSQLIFMTFYSPQETGLTKRIGYFDGTGVNYLTPNNGIFFETDGDLSWNIAKNGSTTETVLQSNWNLDTLDGSGDENNKSGIQYNNDSAQILIIDFEWLGVGRVRVGFIIDGIIVYVHNFRHSNNTSFKSVYMSTPNLPLRYTIQTDGSNLGQLDHICSTVISEGGVEQTGILRSVDNGVTHINADVADTTYAVKGIRLKSNYKDITISPEYFSMINKTSDNFRWSLCINPTIAGTFNYSDVLNSAVQQATGVTANTVSDRGLVIDSGYITASATIGGGSIDRKFVTSLKIGSKIDGTYDELVLCVTPLTAGADIFGSLTFRELL